MSYNYLDVDEKNFAWFKHDTSKGTLKKIQLTKGHLRGLSTLDIDFSYPISVIAGKNGAGKTTILSLAACAFHNGEKGFKLPQRKNTYYTFSDFFIQTSEDIPIDGVEISYGILYNNWKKSPRIPTGVGLGFQKRIKPKNGKWNNYNRRVNRNVIFYGINRIVPHSENSTSKSNKTKFKIGETSEVNIVIKDVVGFILNKRYDELFFAQHASYKIPQVKIEGNIYSGFNMGAGENALFEIFHTIYFAPKGILLVIDEIELGLHEEAQIRFINKLKEIACERSIQIIATTHSKVVLESLPPEARFFIEKHNTETIITNGISPLFAAGKLGGKHSDELDVFVEDKVAKSIVLNVFKNETLKRINVVNIGSATAIARQLAARYKYSGGRKCIAIFDGDKRSEKSDLSKYFVKKLENVKEEEDVNDAKNWFEDKTLFLPGEIWPEKYLTSELLNDEDLIVEISDFFSLSKSELEEIIKTGISAGKHNEFYNIGCNINRDKEFILEYFSRVFARKNIANFNEIILKINEVLK